MAPTLKWISVPGLLALTFAVSSVRADPGLEANATLSFGLESTDESRTSGTPAADEGTKAVTTLDLGLTSVTRSQRLALSYGTDLSYDFSDPDGLETERNSARLSYQYATRSTFLSFDASYQDRDLVDDVIFDEITDTLIIADQGSLENVSFGSRLVLGQDAPLTLELFQRYNESLYSDTSDPDLRDSTNTQLGARLQARLSPVATLSADVTRRELDEDGPGGTQRTTTDYGVSGRFALSRDTDLTAGISYSDIDTNTGAAGDGGLGYSLNLTRDRPNGNVTLGYSATETTAGLQEEIFVGRELVLPRGAVALSVGATRTADFSLKPQVNASLSYAIDRNSQIGLTLSQQSSVNNDDEAILRTQLAVNYQRRLTRRSSLSSSLSYAAQDIQAEGGNDKDTLQFNLSYNYDLDEDWDLVTRYSHSRTENSAGDDTERNVLFLGVERRFDFRP